MEIGAFDYELPPARIAQQPIEPRDAARLLIDRGAGVAPEHRHVRDLSAELAAGDLLVVNDTRVLPARLRLRKRSGGAVEVFLLEPIDQPPARGDEGTDHTAVNAGPDRAGRPPGAYWQALVRPSRKVAPGTTLTSVRAGAQGASVEVLDDLGEGRRVVRLHGVDGHDRTAQLAAISVMGEMPLPPYITAPLDEPERYQTVYAAAPGSAAAPTAGLHFTPALLDELAAGGVTIARVELVVGLDTFRPISTEHVEDHQMHTEAYRVPEVTWAEVTRTRAAGGRVVAVGTTALRALESAAARQELAGRTDLFIHGVYPFAVVDRLLTNFHLPRSSLLVLIDAFVGPHWRELYAEALAEGYRFLSFGDAMLLTRPSVAAAS